eukprot:COSAG02_NODE_6139_length_3774_cov_41.138136_2_plen_39_part_00
MNTEELAVELDATCDLHQLSAAVRKPSETLTPCPPACD